MYKQSQQLLERNGIKRVVSLDYETFYSTTANSKENHTYKATHDAMLAQAQAKYDAVMAPFIREQEYIKAKAEEWRVATDAYKHDLAEWRRDEEDWKAYEAQEKARTGVKSMHPSRRIKPEGPGKKGDYVPKATIQKPSIKQPTPSMIRDIVKAPDSYSLADCTTEAYVRSEQFELICMTATTDGKHVCHAWGEEAVRSLCKTLQLDAPDTLTVAHNARFEGFVLEQRLGVRCNMLVCTMHMMRISGLSCIIRERLASVAEFLAERFEFIPAKGTEVADADGRHLADIVDDKEFCTAYLKYCAKDTIITYHTAMLLLPYVPWDSMALSDLTLKMYTRPSICLDDSILMKYGEQEEAKREEDFSKVYVRFGFESPEELLSALRSTSKTLALLSKFGYDLPPAISAKATKDKELRLANHSPCVSEGRKPNISQRKSDEEGGAVLSVREKYIRDTYYVGKKNAPPVQPEWEAQGKTLEEWEQEPVYTRSLSKDNEEFTKQQLLNPSEEVRDIVRLRLEYGSSKETKRAVKLLKIRERGTLPFAVQMAGAHTHRYSGDDGINLQNLSKHKGEKLIRKAMVAPEGYLIGGADSSQVEARTLAYVANDIELLDVFRKGKDPYAMMAAKIYGADADEIVRYAKASDEEVEQMEGAELEKYNLCVFQRRVGKQVVLGCGYQMGKARFAFSLRQQGIFLTDKDKYSAAGQAEHDKRAAKMLDCYRDTNTAIVNFWEECAVTIDNLAYGESGYFGGPDNNLFYFDGKRKVLGEHLPGIMLPNGVWLTYPNLRPIKYWAKNHKGEEVPRTKFMYTLRTKNGVEEKMIYGGLLTENLVQALAFAVLGWQAVRIQRYVPVAGNVHDEWFSVFPESKLDVVREAYERIMRQTPGFVEGLPLSCEFSYGKCYADM